MAGEGIAQVLHRALRARGFSRRLDRQLPAQIWREAVGEGIAARARPTVLSAGVLHLLVQDHRWRDQLDAARVFLIERLNARLGRPLVRELRFGLAHSGALRELAAVAKRPLRAAAPPPRMPQAAQLEPRLREALLAAAAAARRAEADREDR